MCLVACLNRQTAEYSGKERQYARDVLVQAALRIVVGNGEGDVHVKTPVICPASSARVTEWFTYQAVASSADMRPRVRIAIFRESWCAFSSMPSGSGASGSTSP